MSKDQLTPIVYIEWQDAHANPGWFTRKQMKRWRRGDWLCQDVGFLLEETEKHLVFAQRHEPDGHANGDEQWGGLHKIPKAWVRNKKVLGFVTRAGAFRSRRGGAR